MTLPAAPGPVWPDVSTTRVEATFSDRRIRVVSSSTVGKAAKSSGLFVYVDTISTIRANAILNVNSRSSANAGSGRTIIARIRNTISGMARERHGMARTSGWERIAFMRVP